MAGVAVSSIAARTASMACGGGGRSGLPRPRSMKRGPGRSRAAAAAARMRVKYCSGRRPSTAGAAGGMRAGVWSAKPMAAAELALPPGPRAPRALQTLGFLISPARFMNACRRRYGDVVWLSTAFDRGFVMVFDPELVREVFQASPDRLRAGEANAVLGPLLGSRSVLLLDGAEHLRHRRLLLPPFHGRALQAHEGAMRAAAEAEIDAWPRGEEFALLPSMQSLTLEVIMTAIFGVEDAERRAELKRRTRAALEPLRGTRRLGLLAFVVTRGRVGDRAATQRFEERRRALDEFLYAEIARRREAPDLDERDDVLSMLLQARDEDDQPLTDHELRDELVTLLVAG